MRNERLRITKLLISICALLLALAACDEIFDYLEEEVEIATEARLTITGLEAYEGQEVLAKTGFPYSGGPTYQLWAVGSATNFDYAPAKITSGQATLKVYKYNPISIPHTENYNGKNRVPGSNNEDQNVKFAVAIIGKTYGFVTASFTNGIASGVFVEDK